MTPNTYNKIPKYYSPTVCGEGCKLGHRNGAKIISREEYTRRFIDCNGPITSYNYPRWTGLHRPEGWYEVACNTSL